jgi:acyl-CoA-binding protein
MKSIAIEILKAKELDDNFKNSVNFINENKGKINVSNIEMAHIYGLYKQSTYGDNNKEPPYQFQTTEFTKWTAWNKYKGMKISDAKKQYIDYVENNIKKNIKNI